MATSLSRDLKPRKSLPKPLMLKDYLLDDLSSCSSNGFRSYPRRQCCTTVRFLIEIDHKNKRSFEAEKSLRKSRSKSASPSTTMSAFQRASVAVINAVKHFPFAAAAKPPSNESKHNKAILPRSFSRKLLRRSFWKRTVRKEIEPRNSLNELAENKSKSLGFSPPVSVVTTTAISSAAADSHSSTSESYSNINSKSNSWSDTDFTASSPSGNSEMNSSENYAVPTNQRRSPAKKEITGGSAAVTVAVDSTSTEASTANSSVDNMKEQNECTSTEKQQFSPVSVLDCPFDDEDEVSSLPFRHRLARVEGTKQKLMRKLRRFETLANLEPLTLENQIEQMESDQESTNSPLHEKKNKTEQKAQKLLDLTKAKFSFDCLRLKADSLLLDFFMQDCSSITLEKELLNIASEWLTGQTRESFMGWEVEKKREAYVRDMEKKGGWTKEDEEKEKEKVCLDVEFEVFSSLMDELTVEILTS